jgi:predicted MFS family arabinose efflux permease
MRVMDALIPRLSGEFGIAINEASDTVTYFGFAYGASLLAIGVLGDRYGKMVVVAHGCVVSAIATLACALAPDFEWLRIARLCSGAANSALMTLAMAWIGDVVPYQARQASLSRLLVGMSLGVTCGIFLGGFAAEASFGWRHVFAVLSVLYLAGGLMLLSMRGKLPPIALRRSPVTHSLLGGALDDYRQVLRQRRALVIFIIVCLEGALYFGALAFIPYHLQATHGISLSLAGSIVMLTGVGGLVFSLFAPVLLRLGERLLVLAGGGLAAGGLATIGAAAPLVYAVPAAFCAGLGFYMLHSTLQTNATQLVSERRGAAMAAFSASFFLGQAVGVSALGMLLLYRGSGPAMLGAAFGLFAVSVAMSAAVGSRRDLSAG